MQFLHKDTSKNSSSARADQRDPLQQLEWMGPNATPVPIFRGAHKTELAQVENHRVGADISYLLALWVSDSMTILMRALSFAKFGLVFYHFVSMAPCLQARQAVFPSKGQDIWQELDAIFYASPH